MTSLSIIAQNWIYNTQRLLWEKKEVETEKERERALF
jgi:hypothetical protein